MARHAMCGLASYEAERILEGRRAVIGTHPAPACLLFVPENPATLPRGALLTGEFGQLQYAASAFRLGESGGFP